MKHSTIARSGGSAPGRALFLVSNLNTDFFDDMQYIDLPLPKPKMWYIIENTNTCLILGRVSDEIRK